ncbi:MAG: DDE-type integrase/transposase/recombinase, partial [Acidimicrobiia bacterium]
MRPPTSDEEEALDDDRRRDIALFRYSLIRQAADPSLTERQRGSLVRSLAECDHLGPGGDRVRVSRNTLDRWIRMWRQGGFDALAPRRRDGIARTPRRVLDLAEDLKREAPLRTGAQVAEIIRTLVGEPVSSRTLQRHFALIGLNRAGSTAQPRAFGRFEAEGPNDLWTGDALHGPAVASRKVFLFAFIDDWSRALVGYRWGGSEDTVRLEAALRSGLAARGVPKAIYVDNGSPFASKELLRACAVLGIRLIHSTPGEAAGRGKIERVFRTIREQFLVEVAHRGVADLAELNRLFSSWVEGVYHRRLHTETGQAPIERFLSGEAPRLPTPAELRAAFLWVETRTVTKTATVSLYGNAYEVDPNLVGLKVELLFDPFDLAEIRVRFRGQMMGPAAPVKIGRHVHPRAKPEVTPPPVKSTGIDYLGLVDARLEEATRRRISYAGLPVPPDGDGGTNRQPDDAQGPGGRHDDAGGRHDDAGGQRDDPGAHVDHHDVVGGRHHDDADRHGDDERDTG